MNTLAVRVLRSGSWGNCTVMDCGKTRILLDCGLVYSELSDRLCHHLAGVTAVLITHRHGDHMQRATVRELLHRGVPVYGPADAAALIDGMTPVAPLATVSLNGQATVTALPVRHDVPCLAYVVDVGCERLVYLTDAAGPPAAIMPQTTCLMVECNHEADQLRNNAREGRVWRHLAQRIAATHLELNETLTVLRNVAAVSPDLRDVWLLHLSTVNAVADRCRMAVEQATNARVHVALLRRYHHDDCKQSPATDHR